MFKRGLPSVVILQEGLGSVVYLRFRLAWLWFRRPYRGTEKMCSHPYSSQLILTELHIFLVEAPVAEPYVLPVCGRGDMILSIIIRGQRSTSGSGVLRWRMKNGYVGTLDKDVEPKDRCDWDLVFHDQPVVARER